MLTVNLREFVYIYKIMIICVYVYINLTLMHLPYRSVQMRLYSMHKREFVMVFVAFFACFGLAIFIGLAGEYQQ